MQERGQWSQTSGGRTWLSGPVVAILRAWAGTAETRLQTSAETRRSHPTLSPGHVHGCVCTLCHECGGWKDKPLLAGLLGIFPWLHSTMLTHPADLPSPPPEGAAPPTCHHFRCWFSA